MLTSISEFSTLPAENDNANSEPLAIAAGPDGNLWFADWGTGEIGMINPSTDQITTFSSGLGTNAHPQGIVAGPDGNLWFTDAGTPAIGMINPTTHAISEYSTGLLANASPLAITSADHELWFTDPGARAIGMINPISHVISEFPTGVSHSEPDNITLGPDGNLWFTDSGAVAIGMINPTTHAISEYSTGLAADSVPSGIAASDGNLWFTDYNNRKIGTINPTTHAISEFATSLPGDSSYVLPSITAGPDGNLWFTAGVTGHIGMINPTTHAISAANTTNQANPQAITAGPDGNIWFTEINFPYGDAQGGAIGVATLDTQLRVTGQPQSQVSPNAGFGLTVQVTYDTGVVDTGFRGNVTVTLANNAGGSTLGGDRTQPVVNGTASFSNLTLNNPGIGYTLQVSGNGPTAATTAPFTVTSTPTPTPTSSNPTIVGEQISLVHLRFNKKGKPIGKPVVEVVFQYSTAMNPATADALGNYQVDWISTKKVRTRVVLVRQPVSRSRRALARRAMIKTTLVRVLHPVGVMKVTSDPTNTIVSVVTNAVPPKFAKGGQVTVIGSPPGGVDSAGGPYLGGNVVFTISPQARGISMQ